MQRTAEFVILWNPYGGKKIHPFVFVCSYSSGSLGAEPMPAMIGWEFIIKYVFLITVLLFLQNKSYEWKQVLSIGPLMQWGQPIPLPGKQLQSIIFPPPRLTVEVDSIHLIQTLLVELMPKSLILISCDHRTLSQTIFVLFVCTCSLCLQA